MKNYIVGHRKLFWSSPPAPRKNLEFHNFNGHLKNAIKIFSSAGVSWKQALVVVFRIVGVPGGEFPYRREVSLLVLGYAFVRPLEAWQGALPEPLIRRPHGLKAIGPNPTSRERCAVKFFGSSAPSTCSSASTCRGCS